MSARKLKYAMVGGSNTSFIGPIHRMAIRMDNLADLVAGNFSRDSQSNLETASQLGIAADRTYSDWRKLIDSEKGSIDFITICTTNETHFGICKSALESGIDVFCEKPLSMTAAEAEELGRIARRKRCILGVPFTYTGYPMVKLARDLVANGELGRIDKVVMEYQQGSFRQIDFSKPLSKRNQWKMDPRKSGPSCVVADIGVHAFTMIEYVTGLSVKSLLADLSSFAPGNRLDDDASILLRLDNGAKACLVTSKVATGEENGVRLRVYGDKASLFWNQEDPNYLHVKHPAKPEQIYKRKAKYIGEISAASLSSSRFPAGHPEGFVEALANIYDEFCKAVVSRDAGDFPGSRAGVRSMRFVDAALESSKHGNRWVKI